MRPPAGRGGGNFRGGNYLSCGYNCFLLPFSEISTLVHAYEGEAVTKLTNEKKPYFNAPIYLQNMTQIGKVEEIFGPINESNIKTLEGIVANSYSPGDKLFIDPAKLLPLARFLPQPKGQAQAGRGGRGGGGRGGRGFRGRGGPSRGRGPPGGPGGGIRGRGRS